jgi:hypothetical protein
VGTQKNILGPIFVGIFRIRSVVVAFTGNEFNAVFLKSVGNILEKNQAKNDVLVFGSVHVVAELIGGLPEFGLEPNIGPGIGGFLWILTGTSHRNLSLSNTGRTRRLLFG